MSAKADNASNAQQLECDSYCHANTILWSVLLPPIVVMGLIGNFFIVLVFSTSKKRRRRKPVLCITMVTLACADVLVFLFPITRHWLRHAKLYVSFDVQTLGTGFCKVHEFFVYFSLMFSTWIVVLVSGERFAIICFPLRRSRLLTPRRVIGIISAMATIATLLNAHIMWTRKFIWNDKHKRMSCENGDEGIDRLLVLNVYPVVDMLFSVFLPFLLLVIFTGSIAHKLYRRSRLLKTMVSVIRNNSSSAGRRKLLTPTTRMVLPVPLLFVPLALPVKVWLIVFNKGIPEEVHGTPSYHSWRFRWSILLFLQFCNFANNFFIYSLLSADFRADLARLLCGRCWRRGWCRRRRRSSGAASVIAPPTAAAAVDAAPADNQHASPSSFDDSFFGFQMEVQSCRQGD